MSDFVFQNLSTALLRSVPVALIGLALLLFLRKSSGANRHLVCVIACVLLLALPILNMIPQRKDVSVPVVGSVLAKQVFSPTIGSSVPSRIQKVRSQAADAFPTLAFSRLLFGLYLLGVGLLGIRFFVGYLLLGRTLKAARQFDSAEPYPIRISTLAPVPFAVWWKQYMIVLPDAALGWPETRLTASVRHEAAHIRRGDLAFNLLSFVTKLIYWPNPLVWILGSKLFEAAEAATDDCVLGSGVVADEYADVLLQTASEVRGPALVFSLPMAQSSNVSRRVRAILDPVRNRGAAKPAIAFATCLILAITAIALGRVGSGLQDLKKVKVAGAWAIDVKDGLTVPADASNGFTAVTSGDLKVQLVQLQRWTPKGVEAWKPDGTPLPASEIIPDDWNRHDPAELHLYSRYDGHDRFDSSGAGIGSGPSAAGDPPESAFLGGYPLTPSGNTETIMSLLRIPVLGSSGTTSVLFGFSEKTGTTIYTAYPAGNRLNGGTIPPSMASEFPPNFTDTVHITYPAYGTPFAVGQSGEAVKDSSGKYVHEKILSTEITYSVMQDQTSKHSLEPIAYAAQSLRPIEHDWNHCRNQGDLNEMTYFWPGPPQGIDHIDLVARRSYYVAYLNFQLRPRQAHP